MVERHLDLHLDHIAESACERNVAAD